MNRRAIACLDQQVHEYLRTSSADATNEDSNAVDQIVEKLREHGRRLKAQQNSRLTISRLPAELLTGIFEYVVPTARLDYESEPVDMSWLSFSQVAQVWRSVALGSPGLWTQPLFGWPRIANVMVDRTANLPLTIICTLSRRSCDVFSHSMRRSNPIHALTIQVGSGYNPPGHVMTTLLFDALPRVQHLSIQQTANSRTDSHAILTEYTVDIDSHASQLTTLTLRNCSLGGPNSHVGSSLTRLVIEYEQAMVTSFLAHCRVQKCLGMLAQAPMLEELRLKNWLGQRSIQNQISDPKLDQPLSRLKQLMIADDPGMLLVILSRFRIPGSASITLCVEALPTLQSYERLKQTLTSYYAEHAPPHSIALDSHGAHLDTRCAENRTLHIETFFSSQIMWPLLTDLDTHAIVDAEIDCMYGIMYPEVEWSEVLEALPSVRVLRLGMWEWWFLGVLLSDYASDGSVLNLSALHLQRVDFSHGMKDQVSAYFALENFLGCYVDFGPRPRLPHLELRGCLFPDCAALPLPDMDTMRTNLDSQRRQLSELVDTVELSISEEDRDHWTKFLERLQDLYANSEAGRDPGEGVANDQFGGN
jgi:hypothetical protein